MRKELLDIRLKINSASLDMTLNRLLRLALDNHLSREAQELETIQSTYRYLKQYLLTGYNDSKRETLYRELKLHAYEVSSKMLQGCLIENNRSLAQAKEEAQKNAHYLSSNRQQDPTKDTIQDIFDCYKAVFNALYSSLVISQAGESNLKEVMLNDDFNVLECRLLIAAMMLAQQQLFDIRKYKVLIEVYCCHPSEEVRQYALIALVFAQPSNVEMTLYNDELREGFARISDTPYLQQDLLETQLQVLLAADTKETQKQISEEIMPILKNNTLNINLNDEKTEEQLLDEIFHPSKEEEAMEKIEEGMNRIREMRDAGADIFFAGFSQTKRFPFFYTLMNWFVPFTTAHPQIAELDTGEISSDTIVQLMEMQNFCDSDKYSFYLTFSKVIQQIPKPLLEMLKKGEVAADFDEMEHNTAYMRRLYLQDLYRFYTLYSAKADFFNPFTNERTVAFSTWEPIRRLLTDNYLLQIARQLLVRNHLKPLNHLLDSSFDELNLSYLKLKALSSERQGDYTAAMDWFRKALAFEQDNLILIRKMAQTATQIPDYDLAKQLYSNYIALATDADTADEEYNYALCCLQTRDADTAMKALYKLYYLHEENIPYREALAWGLLMQGKYDEAMKIYASLKDENIDSENHIRRSLLLWLTHDRANAIAGLRALARTTMLAQQEVMSLLLEQNDACLLKIDTVDLYVITDLVFDDSL